MATVNNSNCHDKRFQLFDDAKAISDFFVPVVSSVPSSMSIRLPSVSNGNLHKEGRALREMDRGE